MWQQRYRWRGPSFRGNRYYYRRGQQQRYGGRQNWVSIQVIIPWLGVARPVPRHPSLRFTDHDCNHQAFYRNTRAQPIPPPTIDPAGNDGVTNASDGYMAQSMGNSSMRDDRRVENDSYRRQRREQERHRNRDRGEHSQSPTRGGKEQARDWSRERASDRIHSTSESSFRGSVRDNKQRFYSPTAKSNSESKQNVSTRVNQPLDAESSRSFKRKRSRSPSPLGSHHRAREEPVRRPRDRNRSRSRERWNPNFQPSQRKEEDSSRGRANRDYHSSRQVTADSPHYSSHQGRHRSRSPRRHDSRDPPKRRRSPTPESRRGKRRNRHRRRHRSSSRGSVRSNFSNRSVAHPTRQGSGSRHTSPVRRNRSNSRETQDKMDNRARQPYPGPGMDRNFSPGGNALIHLGYSNSPQYATPNSSYHGSPTASPFPAGRGAWQGPPQQQPFYSSQGYVISFFSRQSR